MLVRKFQIIRQKQQPRTCESTGIKIEKREREREREREESEKEKSPERGCVPKRRQDDSNNSGNCKGTTQSMTGDSERASRTGKRKAMEFQTLEIAAINSNHLGI